MGGLVFSLSHSAQVTASHLFCITTHASLLIPAIAFSLLTNNNPYFYMDGRESPAGGYRRGKKKAMPKHA
jgi:hypothetical protein